MFKGQYRHSVDAKGRIIIPSKFRESLGDSFVVTRGLDHCLFVYSNEEWENIEDKFKEIPSGNKEARKFMRFFFAGAEDCEMDRQGRVQIPAHLRDYADLEKEVFSVGVLNRIEIWSPERWQENEFDDVDEIAERMADMGLMI
ncbi:MAG: division/cell wall cluster transcriptional repressor MraZ [Clostridiales bacterium]|nr:division/cell wall cluster transcriptional repressor MraZ [Clostridiales bacterium]